MSTDEVEKEYCVNEEAFPFLPQENQPNFETIKAIEEARAGSQMKSFNSIDTLMDDLYTND